MIRILVSIISDQTIPNLLLIKELENTYDQMAFITTESMEESGKSRWIEQAANAPVNSVSRIVVEENNWNHIAQKLIDFTWPENSEFIVNLTGGTKVMTLAVFEFFAKGKNEIVYAPIGKNYYEELFPSHLKDPVLIKYRLNLTEYLLAHGLYFNSSNELLYPAEQTLHFFEFFRKKNFRFYSVPEIIKAHQFPTEKDRVYYSGSWYEEYIYTLLKNSLGLDVREIALNVKLFRHLNDIQHDNEFDVVFTKENALFIIECKASVGSRTTVKDKMDHYLHKLGAITRDFGLRVNTYIFTLTDISEVAAGKLDAIEKRKKLLGIKGIIDAPRFYDTNQIIESFKIIKL